MAKTSYVIIVVILLVLIAGGYALLRHQRMFHLYNVAVSPLSDTNEAHNALKQLDEYEGYEAADLLYRTAVSGQEFIDDRKTVAIRLLSNRDEPDLIADLTDMLQPQFSLAMREEVSNALDQNQCTKECIQNVLHYEERLWCGKDVVEEATIGVTDPSVNRQLMAEHEKMIDHLDAALSRNAKLTVEVLAKTYGIGSRVPSAFALHVIDTLGLRAACPLVAASSASPLDRSAIDPLQRLLGKLNCFSAAGH